MRPFTAAAIQLAPEPGPLTARSVLANCEKAADWVEECVTATGADLVVLPGARRPVSPPDCRPRNCGIWSHRFPARSPSRSRRWRRGSGSHLVWGTYERGQQRGIVYNTAVLLGPDGSMLGRYRKTHPFGGEDCTRGGWVTPGDEVCVVHTTLGRISLIICFDGDYPELSRITALRGAEVIARPSALLRSADIWELTNRARAYDNHVYVIGANSTGTDPAGVLYFGNSMIVSPIAEVVA